MKRVIQTRKRTKLDLLAKTETKNEPKVEIKQEADPEQIKTESKPKQLKPIKIEFTEAKPRSAPVSKFGKINPIWKTHFDNIRIMRSKFDAPVDTDGCERLQGVSKH